MTFVVRWSRQAERFLGKLPAEVSRRIVNKVNTITDDPFRFLEHYEGADFYKLRMGSYRLVVDVDSTANVISIRVLGHRRNVYQGQR
jgi:mRNA interferase RelE/StbE